MVFLRIRGFFFNRDFFNLTDQENWEELVEIAVGKSEELQVELINLLTQYVI